MPNRSRKRKRPNLLPFMGPPVLAASRHFAGLQRFCGAGPCPAPGAPPGSSWTRVRGWMWCVPCRGRACPIPKRHAEHCLVRLLSEPRASEAVKKSGTDLSAVRQMPENAIARPGAAVCPVDFFTASQLDFIHLGGIAEGFREQFE